MIRRTGIILALLIAALVAATTVPINGRRLIGFKYRTIDDNQDTVCPDWVCGQSGTVITLTTGEKFNVIGFSPEELISLLLQSNALVRIDRQFGRLAIRRHTDICGNSPEQEQWITLPLHETVRVPVYFAMDVAQVEPIVANERKSPRESESAR